MEYISAHWLELAVLVILILAFTIYVAWEISKKGLRQSVIDLIVYAESMTVENEEKMNYVIDKVIALIPMPLNLLLTRSTVQKFIQKIFDEIKKALDYGREEK